MIIMIILLLLFSLRSVVVRWLAAERAHKTLLRLGFGSSCGPARKCRLSASLETALLASPTVTYAPTELSSGGGLQSAECRVHSTECRVL